MILNPGGKIKVRQIKRKNKTLIVNYAFSVHNSAASLQGCCRFFNSKTELKTHPLILVHLR